MKNPSKKQTVLMLFGCALVFTMAVGASGKRPYQKDSGLDPKKVRPWNGGKPSIPVSVSSDIEGPIPANTDQPVNLGIVVDQPCVSMQMQLRGMDGLVVVSRPDPVTFGTCRPGEVLEHQVAVRVPGGTSGLLAVDLHFEGLGQGVPASDRRSVTKAISIVAEGSKLRMKASAKATQSASAPGGAVVEIGHRGNIR